MSTTYYGRFDGARLLAVYENPSEQDIQAMDLEEVPGWPVTSTGPTVWHHLHKVNGALAWVDPRTADQVWAAVRADREPLFIPGDRVALKAFSQGQPMPAPWAAYQQALRDITEQPDPFNITWPTPPQE